MLPRRLGHRLPFRRLGIDAALQTKLAEGINANSRASQLRSRLSRGSIRDAMHLGMNFGRQPFANILAGSLALNRRISVPIGPMTSPIAALATARLPTIAHLL